MKINGIKALDYREQGEKLTVTLAGTTLEGVMELDGECLRVETDAGDLVEALGGHRLESATYRPADGSFQAVFTAKPPDVTAEVAELGEQMGDVMAALTELAGMVDAMTMGGEANG